MKIHFKRLDHIQLCIPIGMEEEARKFYRDIMGLEEIEKTEILKANGGLWFRIAGIQLHIGVEKVEGQSKRHPAFEVEDLDLVKSHLMEKGVKIKEDIPVPGQKRFSLYDPFDNRIELLERI